MADPTSLMTDKDLIQNIRQYANGTDSIVECSSSVAIQKLNMVANLYKIDQSAIWWWSEIGRPVHRICYADRDVLGLLRSLLSENDGTVFMVVTDDNPSPWPVFEGEITDLLNLISEQHFFEYFLVQKEGRWIVFDTHDNELVVAGQLLEDAQRY